MKRLQPSSWESVSPWNLRLLSAVAAVALLPACSSVTGGERAPKGSVLETSLDVPGTHTYVVIPDGRIDFTVGAPETDLPGSQEYDRAPDGGSFVGVSWTWESQHAVRVHEEGQEEIVPSISLVADGKEYSLDEVMIPEDEERRPVDFFGGAYVAVDGEPEELAIRVEYDGLEQTAPAEGWDGTEDHGAAAALYGVPEGPSRYRRDCGEPAVDSHSNFSLDQTVNCNVQVSRMPYHQSVGWAAADKEWLVLEVDPYPGASASWRKGSDRWEVYPFGGRPTKIYDLDGADPAEEPPLAAPDGPAGDLVIFEVGRADRGTLRIRGGFPTDPAYSPHHDDAPVNPEVRISWRVDLLR